MAEAPAAAPQRKPRRGPNAEKPGAYSLAVRARPSVLDPGDEVRVEVFVSGYGSIDGAKLVFYPSTELVEFGKSTVTSGIVLDGTTAYFGGDPRHPDENGFTLVLTAAVTPSGPAGETISMFSDRPVPTSSPVPQVLAETVQRNPPVLLSLATKKSIRPGPHWMQFVLTYFNGEAWISTTTTAEFTVRTFIQRHEPWAWALGITATICSLLGFLWQALGWA